MTISNFDRMESEEPAVVVRSHEAIALSQYEIVRRIFSSLPMKEVKRLASVCKIWAEVSFRSAALLYKTGS